MTCVCVCVCCIACICISHADSIYTFTQLEGGNYDLCVEDPHVPASLLKSWLRSTCVISFFLSHSLSLCALSPLNSTCVWSCCACVLFVQISRSPCSPSACSSRVSTWAAWLLTNRQSCPQNSPVHFSVFLCPSLSRSLSPLPCFLFCFLSDPVCVLCSGDQRSADNESQSAAYVAGHASFDRCDVAAQQNDGRQPCYCPRADAIV